MYYLFVKNCILSKQYFNLIELILYLSNAKINKLLFIYLLLLLFMLFNLLMIN
jgi:hypothetical protein